MKRAERQQLRVVVEEVRAWIHTVDEIRHVATHLPLSGSFKLGVNDVDLLIRAEEAAASGDVAEAERLTRAGWLESRRKLQPARDAAGRLTMFHHWYCHIGAPQRLLALREELETRATNERDELRRVLSSLQEHQAQARRMLRDVAHLPMTREGAISDSERSAGVALIQLFEEHRERASSLLDPTVCTSGGCSGMHRSAAALSDAHHLGKQLGTAELVTRASNRVAAQLSGERVRLPSLLGEIEFWHAAGKQAKFDAEHAPLTRTGALSDFETAAIRSFERVYNESFEVAANSPAECSSESCAPHHESTAALAAFHASSTDRGDGQVILESAKRVAAARVTERERLRGALEDLEDWYEPATSALQMIQHMPITRAHALSQAEFEAAEAIKNTIEVHSSKARQLLDTAVCETATCRDSHESAASLHGAYLDLLSSSAGSAVIAANDRLQKVSGSELEQVRRMVEDLETWYEPAMSVLQDPAHLPFTRQDAVTEDERTAAKTIYDLVSTYGEQARRLLDPGTCDATNCDSIHEAVAAVHRSYVGSNLPDMGTTVTAASIRIRQQAVEDRDQISTALQNLDDWNVSAALVLRDVEHLPLTRQGSISAAERSAAIAVQETVDSHSGKARQLLDGVACETGSCESLHESASSLCRVYEELLASGSGTVVVAANTRIQDQLKRERIEVAGLHRAAAGWQDRIQEIRRTREDATATIKKEVRRLVQESTTVKIHDANVRLLPLGAGSKTLVASLTLLRDAPLSLEDQKFLKDTHALAGRIRRVVKSGLDSDWKCFPDGRCAEAHAVLPNAFLLRGSIESRLDELRVRIEDLPTRIDKITDPTLGLSTHLPANNSALELLPSALSDRARKNLAHILNAEANVKEAAGKAHSAAVEVRAADVAESLRAMDLEVLRKAAPQGKFRLGPLENRGLQNVWEVLQFNSEHGLVTVPGLGATTSQSIAQAALRLFEAVRDETPVRIDVKRRGPQTAALLESLRRWDSARNFTPTEDEMALATGLSRLTQAVLSFVSFRILVVVEGKAAANPPSVSDFLREVLDRIPLPIGRSDIWTDFLSRPADYFGMLTELGFITEDEKSMHGDLPEDIVEAVRAMELKREHLTASLRTYQSFGARFALVQEKVVIGDEMGLGKTVEALAVLAHLRARGHSHFLVVCPAAVVSNWTRETSKHTALRPFRLHGASWERSYAAKTWARNGGVAVTTYDLLSWARSFLAEVELGCAIFDEAHYIKNPQAKRSVAAAEIIDSVKYAILMTGTPLENSVLEFRNLIGYIRPDLSEEAPEYLAAAFRKHVAPAYLRRNQEDVLTELPEIVEVDEWMGMSDADEKAYRHAVADGQFMLMRRAAMLSEQSLKIDRLQEIVQEAEANGRRVIVFSYFREVLNEVARLLPGKVFGPLTGSHPAADRQKLVDRFSEADHGAVLVAQITAGGVGLNIQSASVVVICEPQIKPTMEAQAIARAHRMGQTNTVQVHRLLTENSVDERIRDILADKKQLFDEFARDSVIAERAPDAVDVSETELARIVVATERERLFGSGGHGTPVPPRISSTSSSPR